MASISQHLHDRSFQVAVTSNMCLPLRKWSHIGTLYKKSHKDAAYAAARQCNIAGNIIAEHCASAGVVYEFDNNRFIHVGFGV